MQGPTPLISCIITERRLLNERPIGSRLISRCNVGNGWDHARSNCNVQCSLSRSSRPLVSPDGPLVARAVACLLSSVERALASETKKSQASQDLHEACGGISGAPESLGDLPIKEYFTSLPHPNLEGGRHGRVKRPRFNLATCRYCAQYEG